MADGARVFVVSGPSGAGKNTLLSRVMEAVPNLVYSVSATTRSPRKGEVEGKNYFFLSEEEFERRIDAGEFVEWAWVHDHRYGTLTAELDRTLRTGKNVILELDVQGMRSVKALRNDVTTVFIMPPSLDELERRLVARGTAGDELQTRLENAKTEMGAAGEFDFRIVNDRLQDAVDGLTAIFRGDAAT